jgi:hypothetical protein
MALSKFNFNSFDLTTVASTGLAFNSSANGFDTAAAGAMTLIATNTISSGVSSSSFTSGIDSTYDTYLFKFINIHPASDNVYFQINFSVDGGSNYNVTKTTTYANIFHYESGASTEFAYKTARDLAQSTADAKIMWGVANDNDGSSSGSLYLFNPASTTFIKHFISRIQGMVNEPVSQDSLVAGIANTTSAINAVRFNMSSGNIDSGVIKMYGITK